MRDRNQGNYPTTPKPSQKAVNAAQKTIRAAIKKRASKIYALNKVILEAVGELKDIRKEVLAADPEKHAFYYEGPISTAKWFNIPLQTKEELEDMEHSCTQGCEGVKHLLAKKAVGGLKSSSRPRKI